MTRANAICSVILMNNEIKHTWSSPFPRMRLLNGQRVIDERCTCGKLRSEHEDRFGFGHGSAEGCDQFSWAAFVFEAEAK